MNWFKKIFGMKTPEEKLRLEVAKYQQLSFEAQRNGDMRKAGEYATQAKVFEDKLVELKNAEGG